MLEMLHYVIATLCGVSMVAIIYCNQGDMNAFPWAVVIAGLYLISKALLIGRKK